MTSWKMGVKSVAVLAVIASMDFTTEMEMGTVETILNLLLHQAKSAISLR
jgi:hypothetical protein